MAEVHDLLGTESSSTPLWAGIIEEDAASESDQLEVTIPAFDPDQTWGPCPWMPRGATLPSKGDACVVGMAESDEPGTPDIWIIAWWPS